MCPKHLTKPSEESKSELLSESVPEKITDIMETSIVIPKQTFEKLLAARKYSPATLIAIYSVYYWTAKWQKTNQPWCTAKYVALKLHITRSTVCRYNKVLKMLDLIEDVVRRDSKGKIRKKYIRIKYILKKSTVTSTPTMDRHDLGPSDTYA
jgi:hypothetical protein